MTLTIQLPPDIEAELVTQAQALGLDLGQFVDQVLRERVPPRAGAPLSPAERAEAWRQSARGLPHIPPRPTRPLAARTSTAVAGK